MERDNDLLLLARDRLHRRTPAARQTFHLLRGNSRDGTNGPPDGPNGRSVHVGCSRQCHTSIGPVASHPADDRGPTARP